jgi:hypothetical protein
LFAVLNEEVVMKTLAIAALAFLLPAGALADYQPAELHIVVSLGTVADGLTAAEFRIENLPTDYCLIEQQWDSPLTIGNLGYGFAIAFTEVQWGPLVHLGTLHFTAFEPVGDDWTIQVAPSLQSGSLLIVDELYQEIPTEYFAWHRFNCTYWCQCNQPSGSARRTREDPAFHFWTTPDSEICWQELPVFPTAADESSWSAVKALY